MPIDRRQNLSGAQIASHPYLKSTAFSQFGKSHSQCFLHGPPKLKMLRNEY